MKTGFYPRLAWRGIHKNKELYIPYLLTCIGMIMMFYIVCYLETSSLLEMGMKIGGGTMAFVLELGRFVIGAFSVIFIFYTHSFLIRRRKKEFGLYSILGMNKRNLARIMVWESLIVAVISLLAGLGLGILFSKLAELLMNFILRADVDYRMKVRPENLYQTAVLFLGIFFLILLVTLRQIHITNPIELLRSENVGERPPKANWFLALAGILLLGIAYYMAVTTEEALKAILLFFAAVLLVILGTYLLFIAGSVALCRLLQKNKRYYYRTNHFVSVSSMAYRMKRNGAGLASICILSTMVLVMLTSTVCLYGGIEGTLRSRYPRNIVTDNCAGSWGLFSEENLAPAESAMEEVVRSHGLLQENKLNYTYALFEGLVHDGRIQMENGDSLDFNLSSLWAIFVVPLEDYNALTGTQEVLQPGELLMYTSKSNFPWENLEIAGMEQCWKVRQIGKFVDNGIDSMQIISSMFLVVEDVGGFAEELAGIYGTDLLAYHWVYGFDLECTDEEQIAVRREISEALRQLEREGSPVYFTEESVVENRESYYGLYGSLFFLGVMLGIVFVFATALLMYYKQITEGYEDQGRFTILQKVGMTGREIRKSINSQVMTVFFLPLIAAGLHLGFAFPFLYRMLMALGFFNLRLLVGVAVAAYLLFGIGYAVVYRITSRAYYHLVGGA